MKAYGLGSQYSKTREVRRGRNRKWNTGIGRDRKGALLIFYPYAGTEAYKAPLKGYHIQQQQQKLTALHGPLIRPTESTHFAQCFTVKRLHWVCSQLHLREAPSVPTRAHTHQPTMPTSIGPPRPQRKSVNTVTCARTSSKAAEGSNSPTCNPLLTVTCPPGTLQHVVSFHLLLWRPMCSLSPAAGLWGPEEQPCSSLLPCSWAHTTYT